MLAKTEQAIHFPGLNGIRAIASVAVVISHITLALKDFGLDPYIFGVYEDGMPMGLTLAGYGVSMFFVLSGFLITYLLQVEKDRGLIDVRKFYIRRAIRIWPLYYAYLGIAILVMVWLRTELDFKMLFSCLFFSANVSFFLGIGMPFLSHYWSLGVEEQFYLFWPWINMKFKSLIFPIIFLISLLLGTKIWLHFFVPHTILEIAIHTTRFHCMMLGALGAVLYKSQHPLFLKLVDSKLTQSISWLIVLLVTLNKYHIASIVDNEIVSVVALCIIIGQINGTNRLVNLDTGLMNFVGKISYGIYVIHPILIWFASNLFGHIKLYTPLKYLLVYLSITSTTLLLSYLSFAYFESYFLKFKKRLK